MSKENTYQERHETGLRCFSHIYRTLTGRPAPDIKKNKNGRPYIAQSGGEASFDFNISHSGRLCAAAVLVHKTSETHRIGCDIEKIRSRKHYIQTASRCFSEQEQTYINEGEAARISLLRFFEIWTKREAALKAEGKTVFDIAGISFAGINTRHYFLTDITGTESYVLCLAVQNAAAAEPSFYWLSEEKLRFISKEAI